jgi:hypothetical protein
MHSWIFELIDWFVLHCFHKREDNKLINLFQEMFIVLPLCIRLQKSPTNEMISKRTITLSSGCLFPRDRKVKKSQRIWKIIIKKTWFSKCYVIMLAQCYCQLKLLGIRENLSENMMPIPEIQITITQVGFGEGVSGRGITFRSSQIHF